MREIHEFSMGFWPYEFAMVFPWRTHGLSMVNPWRHNSMESPWKTHENSYGQNPMENAWTVPMNFC